MLKLLKIQNRSTVAAAFAAALIVSLAGLASAQEFGIVKGKVRTASGKGIAGASVKARRSGTDVASVTADEDGRFTLAGLEGGRYNIMFEARGYSAGVLYNVEVKKKKTIDLGDRLILSADQGTIVLVKGSVFYKEGTSLSGAKVELEQIDANGSVRKLGNAFTNVSGEFTFRQPEGPAKLRVRASFKGVEGTKEIEVDTAAIYRLAITLDISRTEK